jgi:hypothetical protein
MFRGLPVRPALMARTHLDTAQKGDVLTTFVAPLARYS